MKISSQTDLTNYLGNHFSKDYEGKNERLPFEFTILLRRKAYEKSNPDSEGGYVVPKYLAFELLCWLAPEYGGEA